VVSWHNLFHSLRSYDTLLAKHLAEHLVAVPHAPAHPWGTPPSTVAAPSLALQQPSGSFRFPAADAAALEAFLDLLRAVVEGGGASRKPPVHPGPAWVPAWA